MEISESQAEICRRFGALPMLPSAEDKVGIALDVRSDLRPLNGMRYRPENGTCGWYFWAGGDPSADDDYFKPLHVEHVATWSADLLPYLALPPGWRFLLAPGYEDVWFDEALLDPSQYH